MESARRAPEGTIALLFTDIEGSTRLAAELGPDWPQVLAAHNELVGSAIMGEGGFVDRTVESHSAEIGAASSIPFDYEHLTALARRIGPARTAELKQRGRADNPAERVARACRLARSHAPAPAVARE